MKDIVIVGAGGFAREVEWLIKEINQDKIRWNLIGFVEANPDKVGTVVGEHSVVMSDDALTSYNHSLNVVIAIGNPIIIQTVVDKLQSNPRLSFPNLIHPTMLWNRDRIQIGQGNICCAGNIFTTDIRLGNFNIINLSSTYGHDAEIGSCNVINPGVNLSGFVKVGDCCLIGTGAQILERTRIGNKVVVGAGAVVTKDVPDGLTVVGIPAKPLIR